MVPKIIHFCWLSGEEYPELVQKCILSWKKVMPDFRIICWTTGNFDINSNNFVKEAVECRKWAFASDYIRLYALYNYGGIYLDSDVFVFKSFEPFLNNRAFSAVEYCISSNCYTCNIEAAILGAEKGHPWIKDCLEHYSERKFILDNGNYNQVIIPEIVADIAEKKYGFIREPRFQSLESGICIYPPHVFAHAYLEYHTIKETYAIHLCEGGWYQKNKSLLSRFSSLLRRFCNHPVNTLWMLYWSKYFSCCIKRIRL